MKLSLALSCILVMALAKNPKKETPVFLCGRQLANARVIICYGTEFVSKKNFKLPDLLASGDEKWQKDWPWLGRRGALSASWTRYKRDEDEGLADLCCLKPCTTDVILNYC